MLWRGGGGLQVGTLLGGLHDSTLLGVGIMASSSRGFAGERPFRRHGMVVLGMGVYITPVRGLAC